MPNLSQKEALELAINTLQKNSATKDFFPDNLILFIGLNPLPG